MNIDHLSLNFYYDAGHGWLECSIDLLQHLKIEDKITSYSYIDKKKGLAYLEEDQDAGTLINKLKELEITYSFREIDQGYNSPIRLYRKYS